jgi:hypothetical protein
VTRRFSMPRAEAVVDGEGKRRCANCGDYIDPIDWCMDCQRLNTPCGPHHPRLHKRADAAFCNAECKTAHRSSFARDCL